MKAAAEGDEESVRRLIAEGADVDALAEDGSTALMRASLGGHVRVVGLLLSAGADKELRSNDGWTAARLANEAGLERVLAVLMNPTAERAAAVTSGETAHRMGTSEALVAPKLLRQVSPTFSDSSIERKVEGDVIVEVVILKSGQVRPRRIVKSLELELDRRAIEATRQWVFEPGRLDGEPVDVLAEIVVSFNIL